MKKVREGYKMTEIGEIPKEWEVKKLGDVVEVMKTSGENVLTKVLSITDEDGNEMDSCPHPKQKIYVEFDKVVNVYDLIRMRES